MRAGGYLCLLVAVGCLLFAGGSIAAESESEEPRKPEVRLIPAPETRAERKPITEFGGIRIDPKTRTLRFPAQINQDSGALEYALVHEKGKTHESLLSTTISPLNLNVALLLAHYKPEALDTKRIQRGLRFFIEWQEEEKTRQIPIETGILVGNDKRVMEPGPWIYNGSQEFKGEFLAEQGGSIIAIYIDQSALVNYRKSGFESDDIWTPNDDALPPVGTPVVVVITPAGKPAEVAPINPDKPREGG